MQCLSRPDPDVVSSAMPGGDTILLHLRTSQYFSLNATGSLVWEMIQSCSDLARMSQAISDRFEVTPAMARDSVVELLRELKVHELASGPHSEE